MPESIHRREMKVFNALRTNLPFFAEAELKIRTKSDGVQPFVFNSAQLEIHRRLEEQKKRTGRVRALILKGRQQGVSTYVAARFFHRTIMNFGVKTFIMTHEDRATRNLFEMVSRFHDKVSKFVKPATQIANKEELYFDKLSSGYQIATAGTQGAGRSSTVQNAHFSEMAFWPHAETHVAGVMQAIADGEGTEVIIECTANGPGNLFHKMWKAALAGQNEYEAIFVPWYWQEEYRSSVPLVGLKLTEEEEALRATYGLQDDQIMWRRRRLTYMDEDQFKQEYPFEENEAFRTVGHVPFISANMVLRARAFEIEEPVGPLVIGVDPAGDGPYSDATGIAWRVGRKVLKVEEKKGLKQTQLLGLIRQIIDKDQPARVFIDAAGYGGSLVDHLKDMGNPYKKVVEAVSFGGEPKKPMPKQGSGPDNRRVEMWDDLKDWLDDPDRPVDLPNDDKLFAELTAPTFETHHKKGTLMLESKLNMKKRGVASPNIADAVALTFASPVHGRNWRKAYDDPSDYKRTPWWRRPQQESSGASLWATT